MASKTTESETSNSLDDLGLSEEEQQIIAAAQTIKDYPKGALLIKEGQIIDRCFHVIKGCVRKFHLKDGDEKTTDFYVENDSISTTSSGSVPIKSKYNLECIEATTVSIITASNEAMIYEKFPKFQEMCRISTEQKLEEYQEKLSNFISSTPEERYSQLMTTRPDLLNRVPQYQLASYLGVKPESLSRIRKRLMS